MWCRTRWCWGETKRHGKLLAGRGLAIAREPSVHAEWVGSDHLLCNAFMASRPGHPFLDAVVADLMRTHPKVRLHTEVLTTTGPIMVTRVAKDLPLDEGCVLDYRTV